MYLPVQMSQVITCQLCRLIADKPLEKCGHENWLNSLVPGDWKKKPYVAMNRDGTIENISNDTLIYSICEFPKP